MSLDVQVIGAANLHKVAAHIRAEGRKDLAREMGRALSKAADPIKQGIRTSAAETMPKRGGHQETLDKSLKFRLDRKQSTNAASVSLITYAEGKSERRDVTALEAGKLRHPVFGRYRMGHGGRRIANPWTVTKIRSGFHKRGTAKAMDETVKEMIHVVEDLAKRLAE